MKKPDFTEATYAYAVTNDIVGSLPQLTGIPLFPSRQAEGQHGGGYDIEIPAQPIPLFLQYKIPQILVQKSKLCPPRFSPPYYRMHLRTSPQADQHRLLLRHAANGHSVYYVTPAFHTLDELNQNAENTVVWQNSRFFEPSTIGHLDEDSNHFVAYDRTGNDWWIFSDPEKGKADISSSAFLSHVRSELEEAPVIEDPQSYLQTLRDSLWQSASETLRRDEEALGTEINWLDRFRDSLEPHPVGEQLARISSYIFNTQAIIIGLD